MDAYEYPSEEELSYIENFEIDLNENNVFDLINYIKDIWMWKDYVKTTHGDNNSVIIEICTGGWSGHEEIIDALMGNTIFWMMYWQKSERGGKYTFEVPVK